MWLEECVQLQWSTAVLTLVCAVSLLLWWVSDTQANKRIPGPAGLPFIGSMIPFASSLKNGKVAEYQTELHKKYGPLVQLKAGVQTLILLSDGKLLAELYQKEECALRPIRTLPVLVRRGGGKSLGLVLGNGESHKEMRRFALLSLRDFGVGKKSIDEMIQTEASVLSQHLATMAESKDGVISDLKLTLQHATTNIIHHIVFGHRYEYQDQKWQTIVQTLFRLFSVNQFGSPENFFPIIGKIPALNNYFLSEMNEKFIGSHVILKKYLDEQIEHHRATYVESEIRDFIDLYLKHEKEHKEFYSRENIHYTILDLFRAGSHTTAVTLSWAILYLVKDAETQEQLREEITKVVGDGVFNRKDKDKLIKLKAFINEVHRYAAIAGLIPPHTVSKPVSVKDYVIEPDDIIFGSVFAMHHDKDYWGDPSTFRIDRWIGDNGELLKHDGHFFPFSTGKRVCPGRQLVNIELMVILVEFLRKFKFEKAEGYPELTDKTTPGFTRGPEDFNFKVVNVC